MRSDWELFKSTYFGRYWQVTYKSKLSAGIGVSWRTFGIGFKIDKWSFSWDFLWLYGGVEW